MVAFEAQGIFFLFYFFLFTSCLHNWLQPRYIWVGQLQRLSKPRSGFFLSLSALVWYSLVCPCAQSGGAAITKTVTIHTSFIICITSTVPEQLDKSTYRIYTHVLYRSMHYSALLFSIAVYGHANGPIPCKRRLACTLQSVPRIKNCTLRRLAHTN